MQPHDSCSVIKLVLAGRELNLTLFEILVMNALMSSWVGQDFWHGASAHFKHLAASRRAACSLNVVGLISSKLFLRLQHDWKHHRWFQNVWLNKFCVISLNSQLLTLCSPTSKHLLITRYLVSTNLLIYAFQESNR